MKLILCSDKVFLKDIKNFKRNCELVDNYIKKGNVFVLATSESYFSFFKKDEIPYTHLSCLDGMVVFDKDGNAICNPLDQKLIDKFAPVAQSCTPRFNVTYATQSDKVLGPRKSNNIVGIYARLERDPWFGERKRRLNRILKVIKRHNLDAICVGEDYDNHVHHARLYTIKAKGATLANRVREIAKENNIPDTNKLVLLNEGSIESKSLNKTLKRFIRG